MEVFTEDNLAAAFGEHRGRLMAIVARRMNPVLSKRLSHEDVLSEAYAAAAKRLPYFAEHDDVPVFFKLRTILLQTISGIERRNLQAAGRDAYREVAIAEGPKSSASDGEAFIGEIAADATSPASRVDRDERHALLRSALAALSESDRAIIEMRHFDGMGNGECAAALGIAEKAASIRYIRALERLQNELEKVSCFRKK